MKRLIFSLLALAMGLAACRSDYEKMVAAEREKGVRHDSLWLDLRLGMAQKAFFDTCWSLNGRGILSHGTEQPITTRMDVSEHFSQPVFLNFYPKFEQGVAVEFFAVFVFKNWAPFNESFSQETLLSEARVFLEKTLPGNAFIELNHPEKGKLLAKVDGNRQVLLFPFEEHKAKALISDLNLKK